MRLPRKAKSVEHGSGLKYHFLQNFVFMREIDTNMIIDEECFIDYRAAMKIGLNNIYNVNSEDIIVEFDNDRITVQLMHAIDRDDINSVNALVDLGADFYANTNINHLTPIQHVLYESCEWHNKKRIRLIESIINRIKNPHREDKFGRNVMNYACIGDHFWCLDHLIAKGLDVNHINSISGETSLFDAAFFGSKNCLRALFMRNAKIDHADNEGKTALCVAVSNEAADKECIEFLLANGADVNHSDVMKRTPLYYAAAVENRDIIDLLIKYGANVNQSDEAGDTPIFKAIMEDNVDSMKCLIENGADINHENIFGLTPLYYAIDFLSFECMKILFDHGARINCKNQIIPNDLDEIDFDFVSTRIYDRKSSRILKEAQYQYEGRSRPKLYVVH